MRITISLAAVAALAWAGTASAQTTITTFDPATNTYRATRTTGSGTYIITPSGVTSAVNTGGIITLPPAPVVTTLPSAFNPVGTTPFYAGSSYPFGYTGASSSRT